MRTWIFMRHFEKESHPSTPLGDFDSWWRHKRDQVASYMEQWYRLDRERVRLSPAGRETAQRAAEHLPAFLDSHGVATPAVYSSPYRRALESAHLLLPDASIRIDDRIRDLALGVQTVTSFRIPWDSVPEYKLAVEEEGYAAATPPLGESYAYRRDGELASFLQDLARRDEDAFVVTHLNIIDAVHQLAAGAGDEEAVSRFARHDRIGYGSMLVCAYDPDTRRLELRAENQTVLA